MKKSLQPADLLYSRTNKALRTRRVRPRPPKVELRSCRAQPARRKHLVCQASKIAFRSRCARRRQNAQRQAAGQATSGNAFGKTPRMPRCARQARQRLANATYVCERCVLSEYPAARARASYWFDKHLVRYCRLITYRYHFARIAPRALPDVAWPAARSAALWAFCRRQNAPEGRFSNIEGRFSNIEYILVST